MPKEYAYGRHPQQRLDVYHAASPAAPTVVMIHGGGFARGDKRRPRGTMLFEHLRALLRASGYSVVALNYRLAADVLSPVAEHPYDTRWPGAHDDVVAALRAVRDGHLAMGVSWPVGVIGESAGGNLGFHVARHPELEVAAYMDIAGYADLPAAHGVVPMLAEHYLGCPLEKCPERWLGASAAARPGRTLPLLVWHGELDLAFEHEQSVALARANVPGLTTFVIVPGAGHTGLPGFATPERDAEVLRFFGAHLPAKLGREG